ncbi:hypothetical protein [Streptomyces sp. NBC_00519]|uniref:hypothetical protein n=1 Tax=Streptomyces sp. NBC_00519 TaxID=2975764 RepID=UPI0030DF7A82
MILVLWISIAGVPAAAGVEPASCPAVAACATTANSAPAPSVAVTPTAADPGTATPSETGALIRRLNKLFRSVLLVSIAVLIGVIFGIVNTWVARREGKSWPSSLARGAAALAVAIGVVLAIFTFLGLGG